MPNLPTHIELAWQASLAIKDKVLENNLEVDQMHSEKADNSSVIKAPLVGTFYLSPKPGDPPFVEVGGKVKSGDTLAIIGQSGVGKSVLLKHIESPSFDQNIKSCLLYTSDAADE